MYMKCEKTYKMRNIVYNDILLKQTYTVKRFKLDFYDMYIKRRTLNIQYRMIKCLGCDFKMFSKRYDITLNVKELDNSAVYPFFYLNIRYKDVVGLKFTLSEVNQAAKINLQLWNFETLLKILLACNSIHKDFTCVYRLQILYSKALHEEPHAIAQATIESWKNIFNQPSDVLESLFYVFNNILQ